MRPTQGSAMARFSLKWLFVGVAILVVAVVCAFACKEWFAVSREAEIVRAAIQQQTNAPQDIRSSVFGFGLIVDFRGTPINEATAKALSQNRRLSYFTLLNCPVTQKEVTILNRGDVFIMVGDDDEPPIGSLQGHRIVTSGGKPIQQTNF
jgi:hypothetical protein